MIRLNVNPFTPRAALALACWLAAAVPVTAGGSAAADAAPDAIESGVGEVAAPLDGIDLAAIEREARAAGSWVGVDGAVLPPRLVATEVYIPRGVTVVAGTDVDIVTTGDITIHGTIALGTLGPDAPPERDLGEPDEADLADEEEDALAPGADAAPPAVEIQGATGTRGADLRMRSNGTITLTGAVNAGAGGPGGGGAPLVDDRNAVAGGSGNGNAKGGRGGRGGNVDVRGNDVDITGAIASGRGGDGQDAFAFGRDGAPCADGGDATARGGKGGDAGKIKISAKRSLTFGAGGSLTASRGGNGGAGTATGGDGGDCNTCTRDGGEGGKARAEGGDAGKGSTGAALAGRSVDYGPGGFAGVIGVEAGGNGGGGLAFAGEGGDGGTCPPCPVAGAPGSDGGKGGDKATAKGGDGAKCVVAKDKRSGACRSAAAGNGGDGDALGGDGGDGGHGQDASGAPGRGGNGERGTKTASAEGGKGGGCKTSCPGGSGGNGGNATALAGDGGDGGDGGNCCNPPPGAVVPGGAPGGGAGPGGTKAKKGKGGRDGGADGVELEIAGAPGDPGLPGAGCAPMPAPCPVPQPGDGTSIPPTGDVNPGQMGLQTPLQIPLSGVPPGARWSVVLNGIDLFTGLPVPPPPSQQPLPAGSYVLTAELTVVDGPNMLVITIYSDSGDVIQECENNFVANTGQPPVPPAIGNCNPPEACP